MPTEPYQLPPYTLLRPLAEGETIQPGDCYANAAQQLACPTPEVGAVYDPQKTSCHFRPVPVPRWIPVSESIPIGDGGGPSVLWAWANGDVEYRRWNYRRGGQSAIAWMPIPELVPPPDLERVAFEKWAASAPYFRGDAEEAAWAAWKTRAEMGGQKA